jgi:hypothetical protein
MVEAVISATALTESGLMAIIKGLPAFRRGRSQGSWALEVCADAMRDGPTF